MKLSTLAALARNHEQVHIIGHTHPDGDCVGATLGMVMLLAKEDVEATVLLEEKPESYQHLPMERYIQTEKPDQVEMIITMDASSPDRLGDFEELLEQASLVVNIDHHASNTMFGDENHVVTDASSTAEMVYYMMDDVSFLDKEIAEALYTGIIYDTGGFKHSNVKESTHLAAAKLVTMGIDFTGMMNRMFFEQPLQSFKAQGLAFARLALLLDEKVAVSYLSFDDFQELGLKKSHTERIVQLMNEVKGVEVAIFFYALDETTYKISFRSKGEVDVCALAGRFGGGGHVKAAGASFTGTIEEAIDEVMEALMDQMEGDTSEL